MCRTVVAAEGFIPLDQHQYTEELLPKERAVRIPPRGTAKQELLIRTQDKTCRPINTKIQTETYEQRVKRQPFLKSLFK